MKEIIEKKDPNLAEKVKIIKEQGEVSKNAMDTNAKNTKEYFETLKKILETNLNIDDNYRKYAEKEIEYYIKALDIATTDEERKEIHSKMEKLHDDVKKISEKILKENEDIKEIATKETEDNKKFNWSTLLGFGTVALSAIGAVALFKENPDMLKKLIDKK